MTDLKDLKDYGYVPQVPLEALFKNLGYKQAKYDQTVQQYKAIEDSFAAIPAYGPDAAEKQRVIDLANKEIAKFASAPLDDPNVRVKLNNLMGQISQSLGPIAIRGRKYENDMATLKDLQEKGKSVPIEFQPSILAANKYYSGDVYDPNVKFTGQVQVAPDLTEKFGKIVAGLPEKIDIIVDPDGTQRTVKSKDYSRLETTLQAAMKLDPELANYSSVMFANKYADVNWDNQGKQMVAQDIAGYQADLEADRQLILNTTSPEVRDQALKTFAATKARLEKAMKIYNSGFTGGQIKSLYKDRFDTEITDDWATTHAYFNTTDLSLNERKKLEMVFNNDLAKLKKEYELKGELEEKKAAAKADVLDIGTDGRIPVMDEYYQMKAGKLTTQIYADPDGWGNSGLKNSLTPEEISTSFNVAGVTGDDRDPWKPVTVSPAIKAVLSNKISTTRTDGDDYSSSTVVNQNIDNVFVDSKGNMGYIYTGADGTKSWGTLSESGFKASVIDHGTKGSAKGKDRFNALVTAYGPSGPTTTTPQTPAATAAPTKPADRPGFTSFYIPGNPKPFQIPTDSIASFKRDNPSAVKY